MITKIAFSTAPMRYGSRRSLLVESTVGFLEVKIKCFVGHPPPPVYKECPECGTFQVASGSTTTVKAPSVAFTAGRNQLEVIVSESTGDKRNFLIDLYD